MKNELGKIALTLLLFFIPILAFSQEISNEKYQKILDFLKMHKPPVKLRACDFVM